MPARVFEHMREEEARRTAEREYRAEMLWAWRNVFSIVDWHERSRWQARGPIPLAPYGEDPMAPVELHHWQFARRLARDMRDGSVLYVTVGRRSDRDDWTPLEQFLPGSLELGELVT
jgi:hypothetical protein